MIVESSAVAPFFKNGFIVGCERTSDAVCIDPGDEVDALVAFAARRQLTVRHILLTHAHLDHVTGVPAAKRAFGAPVHLHRDDLFLYDRAADQAAMFGVRVEELPPVDEFYVPGDVVRFGEYDVRPLHTPGHCPGGVCLAIGRRPAPGEAAAGPSALFVGDTLFMGSIGRTDLPGGNLETLLASIRAVLFSFSDDTTVYPGHGPTTTIGHERRTNPFLSAPPRP